MLVKGRKNESPNSVWFPRSSLARPPHDRQPPAIPPPVRQSPTRVSITRISFSRLPPARQSPVKQAPAIRPPGQHSSTKVSIIRISISRPPPASHPLVRRAAVRPSPVWHSPCRVSITSISTSRPPPARHPPVRQTPVRSSHVRNPPARPFIARPSPARPSSSPMGWVPDSPLGSPPSWLPSRALGSLHVPAASWAASFTDDSRSSAHLAGQFPIASHLPLWWNLMAGSDDWGRLAMGMCATQLWHRPASSFPIQPRLVQRGFGPRPGAGWDVGRLRLAIINSLRKSWVNHCIWFKIRPFKPLQQHVYLLVG